MSRIIVIVLAFITITCADNKSYSEARKIAVTQYIFLCTGGSSNSCKTSCDSKCGIDSTPLNSNKLDCAKSCIDDCNRNCNSVLLFLLNTKND